MTAGAVSKVNRPGRRGSKISRAHLILIQAATPVDTELKGLLGGEVGPVLDMDDGEIDDAHDVLLVTVELDEDDTDLGRRRSGR